MSEVVLRTHGLVKRFGGLTATNNVSLTVTKGSRHALIGPNGAGKTTLINQLTGVLPPTNDAAWQVEFDKYKGTDQFKYVHANFALSDFKFIF